MQRKFARSSGNMDKENKTLKEENLPGQGGQPVCKKGNHPTFQILIIN